ncbi:MAG: alpha/beta hydrolase-fold protein [Vicinamibacterales bacterium]
MSNDMREPFTLPRTTSLVLMSSEGRQYRIFVAWPDSPAPPRGFPVVHLLDAATSFATLVEGLRLRTRRSDATGVFPAVVVGIDHVDDGSGRLERTFDYTPWPPFDPLLIDGDPSARARSGGATAFLTFLTRDLRQALPDIVPVSIDTDRRSLFGHSMAGLFVLHTLFTEPATFSDYVAISPSIWWNRPQLHEAVPAHAMTSRLVTRRLLIGVAEYDQVLAPWQFGQPHADAIARRRLARRMVDDAREMAEACTPLTETVFELYAGEDHASVVARGLGSCLRFCLGPSKQANT